MERNVNGIVRGREGEEEKGRERGGEGGRAEMRMKMRRDGWKGIGMG